MRMSVDQARDLCQRILLKYGVSEKDAQTVTDIILDAEVRQSHGLPHLPRIVDTLKKGQFKDIEVVRENECTALVDGGNNLGELVGAFSMELSIRKAKSYGVGLVGTFNAGYYLIAGTFARMAVREDLVSIIFSNSLARIAPHGSIDPVFGTNPITIGIPSNRQPIVLDMSTAVMPTTAIRLAEKAGRTLPPNCAMDKDGKPTTDPTEALQGAYFPFGGYKGSGLALAIELLAGPLVRAKAGKTVGGSIGYLFLTIAPHIFVEVDDFKEKVSLLIQEIEGSRKGEGVEEILVPGTRSDRNLERAMREGITIPDALFEEIQQLLQ